MKLVWRISAMTFAAALLVGSIFLVRRPADPVVNGKRASAWAQDLLSSDYRVRNDAKAAFHQLGEAGVPQLEVLLRQRNPSWEGLATSVSARTGLFQYTVRDSQLARQRAAEMIGLLGPRAHNAVQELIPALAVEPIAPDVERAILKIGPSALEPLRKALRSRDARVRTRAARILKEFPLDEPTLRALLRLSHDDVPGVRREAAVALGETGETAGPVAERLFALTMDPDETVRAAAAEALGKSSAAGAETLQRLEKMLRDLYPAVRLQAARALWRKTGQPERVLPALIELLESAEGWQAAYSLADLKQQAAPAVDALADALKRERVPRPFRNPPSAAFALGQIGAEAVPALREMLVWTNPAVRMSAVMALGFMGNAAAPAAPDLAKLLRDRDREVRHTAAITLAGIGASRDVVMPALIDCLEAEDVNMRMTAAEQLRRIAPEQVWIVSLE